MQIHHQLLIACACILPLAGYAGTSFTVTAPTADTFLSSNAPSSNYGGAGTLDIAGAGLSNGAYDSLMQFSTAGAAAQFNTTYGAGNWTITGVSLMLASSFGTAGAVPNNAIFNNVSGGGFGISFLVNNSWTEGTGTPASPSNTGVNCNSIPGLLAGGADTLGTFTYTPPGNNVYADYTLPLDSGLVSDADGGGAVSLFFFPTDGQISYLINSKSFMSAKPELVITATPEPATLSLLAVSLGGLLVARRRAAGQ